MRSSRSLRCAAVCLAGLAVAASGAPGLAQEPEEYHRRADAALETFLLRFWSQSRDYLREQYPGVESSTHYWTFAQGFDALLDGVERSGGEQYAGLIETFYEAQDRRGWIVGWYDDENWMALALIRAYDLTGDGRYLDTARMLYDDIRNGWDTTCCGDWRGGIWWDKGHTQKATAANAGPVITGVRLHERTGDPSYLDFARQLYTFWFQAMVDRATYQVTDHINTDGTKVFWRFTYNEGLMIGAAVELHRATGEPGFLTHARRIAEFMVTRETVATPYGRVLTDGSNVDCTSSCHAFKGIALRYLALLHALSPDEQYLGVMRGCADAIWNLARNESQGLFSVSWTGPPMAVFSEPQTASAVMALNVFARAIAPYPGSGIPRNRYEAENAVIRGVALEAANEGFSGWGYVANWQGSGQSVEFRIDPRYGGPHEIAFRYAAGAGAASRGITIAGDAGTTIVDNLVFPATASWADWGTVSVTADLGGDGALAVITVAYDPSTGGSGFLNLDYIEARPLVPGFERGDANSDGQVDLSDAVAVIRRLFVDPARAVTCAKSADADDSGVLEVTDAIRLLNFLFLSGPPPAEPFPGCGRDVADDDLDCDSFAPCGFAG